MAGAAGTPGGHGEASRSTSNGVEPDRRQHRPEANKREADEQPLGVLERCGAWRWTTGASLAAAMALLAFALLRPAAAPQQVAALLPNGPAATGFLAETLPDGKLRLDAVAPVTVAAGKDLELWA